MSLINVRDKTIQAKIVYYGTALSGKTTSLQHVHRVIDPDHRVELVSLNTEGDRTFFFDFLPIPLGLVNGYQLKIQAFTVPGQVKYNLTRRYVLRGADAVLFVADSSPSAWDENAATARGLVENLHANALDPERVPVVLQYNKRDLPDALPVTDLRAALNPRGLAEFETVATTGDGVFEAFSEICATVVEQITREYRVGDPAEARAAIAERLHATLAAWSARAPAPCAPALSVREPSDPSLSTLGTRFSGDEPTAVVEVSSADVPDLPDAETLLRHAVDTNIESARLLSELTETKRRLADHVRQLAALHQTGVTLSSELDTDRLLDCVLASALRTVDAAHGSVLLLAEGRTRPEERLVIGFDRDPLVARTDELPEFVARIREGRPFVADAGACADPASSRSGALAALVAPLVNQGEVLGALVAYVVERPLDLDVRERLRFLAAVSSQAAVALANAQLYAKVESFNRELELKVEERTRELASALEELKALDRLKDDFLASMSHELLTPLHSIGSAAEILTSVAGDEGPAGAETRREFSAVVQRESARLASLLQSVLDLSQVEAGKVSFAQEPVRLKEVALASFERHRAAFKAARTRLKVRVEEGMPDALADPAWLGRALDELVGNAVKFGSPGGAVELTIRRDGDHVRIDVRDDGPGVPEALRASIFEKFKQVGDVLTDKPAGLGLGLPMARMLVERMGGRIWLESPAGGGAVFCVRLESSARTPGESGNRGLASSSSAGGVGERERRRLLLGR